jgi:hypothetical protein
VQFIRRLRSRFDRRLACNAKGAHHLHGASSSLWLGRSGASQDGSSRRLSIDTVRLASPPTRASIRSVDLNHLDIASTKPASQPGAVATSPFDPNLSDIAVLASPAKQVQISGGGRRNAAGALKPATLIERRCHMQLGMRVYPDCYLLMCLSGIVQRGRPTFGLAV